MKTTLIVALVVVCIACNNHTTPVDSTITIPVVKDSIKPKKDSVAIVKPKAEDPLPPEKYKSTGDSIGWELLDSERVGDIKIGMAKAKVLDLLGKPDKKTKPMELWIDGATYQEWDYSKKGISISMNVSDNVVGEFTIYAPCELKTKRRIGIGSTSKEVIEAYKKAIKLGDNFISSHLIIAGSAYGGIQFTIKDKKVTEIFFGATAE